MIYVFCCLTPFLMRIVYNWQIFAKVQLRHKSDILAQNKIKRQNHNINSKTKTRKQQKRILNGVHGSVLRSVKL